MVDSALKRQAAVALLGPRQSGKTTLALEITKVWNGIYLDLESSDDRAKLTSPKIYFEQFQDQLIILDEIYKMPSLFETLRGVIDSGRRIGKGKGRFLLLGSASLDLLKQSGETLAGRIAYIDMFPLNVSEVLNTKETHDRLWLRGGYPDSFLAINDTESFLLRKDLIRSYLERDVPMFAPKLPSSAIERLWIMLAHKQGSVLNTSEIARMMEVSVQSVGRYTDLLNDLFLVRRLNAYHINLGKRLVKAPKIYIRDSGLLHRLLNLPTIDTLFNHPILGISWEGFVLENVITELPWHTEAFFYRTSNGAEQDLVLVFPDRKIWTVEIKLSLNTNTLSKGFYNALADIKPDKAFVIYRGQERFPLGENITAIGLKAFVEELRIMEE